MTEQLTENNSPSEAEKDSDDNAFRIFVSYARSDVEKASRLVKTLESVGFKVWWDDKLRGGSRYSQEIEEALKESHVVIGLLSNTSVVSRFVRGELAYAADRSNLIPILIEPCEIPVDFRALHVLDFSQARKISHDDPEFIKLVETINNFTGQKVGVTTPESRISRTSTPKRILRYTLAAVLLAATAYLTILFREPELKHKNLRIGVVVKNQWKFCQARFVYSQLAENINIFFSSNGINDLKFDSKNIQLYTSFDELRQSLLDNKVDLAGELSPFQIALMYDQVDAHPFIAPNYGGQDTYKAVFFADADRVKQLEHPWEDLLRQLSSDNSNRAALADESSTAGYWYPRYKLLHDLNPSINFQNIHVREYDYARIYDNVKNNYKGVIIGAIPEFRHCKIKKLNDSYELCLSKFPIVAYTSPIPNGGFIVTGPFKSYLDEHNYLGGLQRAWEYTARKFNNPALASSITTETGCTNQGSAPVSANEINFGQYLPKSWTATGIDFYNRAINVFNYRK
jgi:hypothetical protein